MPSTGIGVYGGSAVLTENDEISSTYEGRHITVNETDITGKEDTYIVKGHPCVVGEHIVGVAFNTGTVADELISIDTEGIWALKVYATDELGNVAVVAGDELYIDRTTALISKNNNKNTHTLFGYALGNVPAGATPYVIAVKVHWMHDDSEELVGVTGVPFESTRAGISFREYYYEAQGGGIVEAQHTELSITTVFAVTACVNYNKLTIAATGNWIHGRASVIEARLEITAGDVRQDTMAVMCLDFSNACTDGINNYLCAYIQCRERSVLAGGSQQMNNLFNFSDITPAAVGIHDLFSTSADCVATHKLKFVASGTYYWILCTTTAPA